MKKYDIEDQLTILYDTKPRCCVVNNLTGSCYAI